MKVVGLLLGSLALLVTNVASQRGRKECFANIPLISQSRSDVSTLTKNTDNFGLKLFTTLAKATDKSIFVSPYGIWSALGLAYLGSEGKTKEQLGNVLGLGTNKIPALSALRQLSFILRNQRNGPTLKIVDKAYFASDIVVEECVKNAIVDVESINFQDSVRSAQTVNNVVSTVTEGKITEIVQPSDMLQARFLLLNAIYFKGSWLNKFKPERTRKAYFTDETAQRNISIIPLMVMQNTFFNYVASQSLGAHILELPYAGEEIAMYALLPEVGQTTTNSILQQLTKQNLDDALSKLSKKPIDVAFPKFKMNTEYGDDLKQELERLGISDLFGPAANLSAFSRSEQLFADAIYHKATVEINEEGTVAAAATSIIGTRSGASRPFRIVFNRPFIFLIRHKSTMSTLFAGVYRNPSDTQTIS